MSRKLIVYVDVDETFVRNYSTKRIPIPSVIQHIKDLKDQGAELYCWSSGGSEYAKDSAKEFGIDNCFTCFLPKPDVLIDDMNIGSWRYLLEIHPNQCIDKDVDYYQLKLKE